MTLERVFTVDGAIATPASPISLAEAGLKERKDLQEWVIAHPEILGPGVLVLTFEFDSWKAAGGVRPLDRLDVLGIDIEGRLVVAELKRDRATDTVEMQAVKYAAMASRFTEERLVESHLNFLTRDGNAEGLDEEAARDRIVAHAGELDPEMLRAPRLVLVAGDFPPVVTASVVWLTEMGLDITLQRVQAYRVFDDRLVVTVSQIFPIPDIEDFTVSPAKAEQKAVAARRRGSRERSVISRLVAAKAIPEGTPLALQATDEVSDEVRAALEDWIAADPSRGRATWRNNRAAPLEWEADGSARRPTPIVAQALSESAGYERGVRATRWWCLADGRDLAEVAATAVSGPFDWGPLHGVLAQLPQGRWTTYGDLADLVGTGAQALGTHILGCNDCVHAHRVLNWDGRSAEHFAFSDPDETRTQEQMLAEEGVAFTNGRADDALQLRVAELEDLAEP